MDGAGASHRKDGLTRADILPEPELPRGVELLAAGRARARSVQIGRCSFLDHHGVASEIEYKQRYAAAGEIMLHAQIGYRDPTKSRRAWVEIAEATEREGRRVDRYGICLDWSMGYPRNRRAKMPRGTGLILETPDDFVALTAEAPVAPHFGDFVIGTPAAVENTEAALHAGATTIGNLGQYFTFRMPREDDDLETTAASLEALALCAAQPVPVLIHSNLDDGFAALFTDLACAYGAVLLERYLVEDLIGGHIGHCYGHTFSQPLTRLAFLRALARGRETPGTMIYGNTTVFREGASDTVNYAALASYLLVDAAGQALLPSGHAIHPVPVSEAERIPDIEEVVAAQLFALRSVERSAAFASVIDIAAADAVAERIVGGGLRFKERVLSGLEQRGFDCRDPFELLLALRRIGAKRLEEHFGPGAETAEQPRGRTPLVEAPSIAELSARAGEFVAALSEDSREALRDSGLRLAVVASDVHEYGKILVEAAATRCGLGIVDGGTHSEPAALADLLQREACDALAISTYNGVARDYLAAVRGELEARGLHLPVYIGGKLNQIPEDSNSSLPVDVTEELRNLGAVPCRGVGEMLEALAEIASKKTEGNA